MAERLQHHADAGAVANALGKEWGFSGDQRRYHRPENCFLNHCLDQRLGMPITLVCLWMLICRRLGYASRAIALPGHVVGGWDGGYVDCFDAGRPIDEEALHGIARHHGQSDAHPYLAGTSDRNLLKRFALNLAVSYRKRGDLSRTLIATTMAARST
jgi:regulator of sirC expression with transglutaminase-like and TPR domain